MWIKGIWKERKEGKKNTRKCLRTEDHSISQVGESHPKILRCENPERKTLRVIKGGKEHKNQGLELVFSTATL